MIYRRDARGRDFRFFEKKLGKKLPCWVVALKAILRFIIAIKGYNPARKLLRSFSRKATTRPLASPVKSQFEKYLITTFNYDIAII